jgi:hypothetical protein
MKSTYATFTDPKMAERAGGALLDHGLRAEHLSIIFPEGYEASEKGHDPERKAEHGITTTTSGDAASGSAKGAGIGLAAGALAALAAVFIPGVGLVIGGGALAIAIGGVAGTTAAGAIAGGVTGYLKDQGVPDEAVAHYTRVLNSGGAMVSVTPTDEDVDNLTVESILQKYDGTIATYANASAPSARLI